MDQRLDKRDALDALRRGPDAEGTAGSGALRRRTLVLAVAILAIATGVGTWWFFQPRPVTVRAAEVTAEKGDLGTVLTASGYVVAQLQATVAAQTTGMIKAVLVQEGEHVQQGQILAKLDDSAAQASVASAESQMRTDQALVPQYQAQLDHDQRTLARYRALAAQDAISQASVDAAHAAVETDKALLAHAEDQVEVDRKNLDLARTILSYTVIRAPFAGVVTERYAHPGEMISPQAVGGFTQTGICTIVDMSSLEVDVDVNETLITRLHARQRASVVLDSYPDWRIPAHIITIVPTANRQKATVKVRVGFDKPDPRILPQLSAQVWFEADGTGQSLAATGITIPKSAVRGSHGHYYVYRIDGGVARRVPVRVVPLNKGTVRVLSGLQEGDRIVTSADEPLADGKRVREQ